MKLRAISIAMRKKLFVRGIEVQSDAKEVVRWIQERVELRGVARELVNKVVRWFDINWSMSLRAILREQNKSTDVLAMMGATQMAD